MHYLTLMSSEGFKGNLTYLNAFWDAISVWTHSMTNRQSQQAGREGLILKYVVNYQFFHSPERLMKPHTQALVLCPLQSRKSRDDWPLWKAPKPLSLCQWVCTALSADKQLETCQSRMQGNSPLPWIFVTLTYASCVREVFRLHIPPPLQFPPLKFLRCTSEGNVTSLHFLQCDIKSLCLTWHWQVFKVLLQNVSKLEFLKYNFY